MKDKGKVIVKTNNENATISFDGVYRLEAKKMYFISDDILIEKIDAIISEHNGGGLIQTLDGENGPANPPRGGGQ
jgi:hypothetical protein